MSVRYDDSLPRMVDIIKSENIDPSSDKVIIIRDSIGRLGIVSKDNISSSALSEKLKAGLSSYAMPEPVLPSILFDSINESGSRKLLQFMGDDHLFVRIMDRRVVGNDWLSDFAPRASGAARLVFGSLKGGVGRTTAIAVLAADLAQKGYKVLCIDLDLEAPGLGTMLLREHPDDRRPRYGVIDYLVENGLGSIEDDELFDYIGISHFASGAIHVLPAVGRITDEHPANMIGKLSRALTEDILQNERRSIATQLREMVDRFVERNNYDAILVDARAGLSETTASTWLGLGARKILLFGTDQPQTFRGYSYVLSHLTNSLGLPDVDSSGDWRTYFSFIQSKASNLVSKRTIFREKLHDLCSTFLYDKDEGVDIELDFNFGFKETGVDIPHDATHIEYHPTYEAFDPISNNSLLEPDIYKGPFAAFLDRSWKLLELERRP